MRILRAGFWLVAAGLTVICGAVSAADCVSGCGQRFFGDTQRVGTHVGDKADGTFAGNLHALIELLRDHHRAARSHVELAGRLLLERRRDKGRRRGALFLRLLYAGHSKRLTLQCIQHRLYILLVCQLAFLRIAVVVRGKASGLSHTVQIHVQRPVFLRDKGPDLVFAVDDQTGRDGLHAAGRQALADLFPE